MSFRILQGWAVFLGLLVLLGGGVIKASIGKIEIGSIDPFGIGFCLLLALIYTVNRKAFDRFVSNCTRILTQVQNLKHPKRNLLLLVAFVFFLVFIGQLCRHLSFDTHLFDMGMVNQALFYPFSDHKLLQSDLSPYRSYLVDHFAPTLLLLTPLTGLFHSNILVFALKALLLGSGTLLLIRKGPLKDRPELYLIAGFILLSQRSLRNEWDFREDSLGFLFLCGALISLYSRHIAAYFVCLVGYMLSKEHLAVVGLGIVAPILLSKNLPYKRSERLQLAAFSAALLGSWALIVFSWITPALQSGLVNPNNITQRFPEYGNSPKEIILTLLSTPTALLTLVKEKFLTKVALKYLVLFLAPYLYFGRLAWPWILAASIGIAANMGSNYFIQRTMTFHYDLAFLPFVMMAVLEGIAVGMEHKATSPGREKILLAGILLALTFSGRWPMFHIIEYFPTLDQVKDTGYLEQIPCQNVITGNARILSKLNHCPEIRPLDLPEVCSDAAAEFSKPHQDTSQLKEQGRQDASEFVLDLSQDCEKKFSEVLLSRKAELHSKSPDGRYAHLRISAPWKEAQEPSSTSNRWPHNAPSIQK